MIKNGYIPSLGGSGPQTGIRRVSGAAVWGLPAKGEPDLSKGEPDRIRKGVSGSTRCVNEKIPHAYIRVRTGVSGVYLCSWDGFFNLVSCQVSGRGSPASTCAAAIDFRRHLRDTLNKTCVSIVWASGHIKSTGKSNSNYDNNNIINDLTQGRAVYYSTPAIPPLSGGIQSCHPTMACLSTHPCIPAPRASGHHTSWKAPTRENTSHLSLAYLTLGSFQVEVQRD